MASAFVLFVAASLEPISKFPILFFLAVVPFPFIFVVFQSYIWKVFKTSFALLYSFIFSSFIFTWIKNVGRPLPKGPQG